MTTRVALAMSLTGVEATLEADRSRIRAGEMDTGMVNMRYRTTMDVEMKDMKGRIETDTGMVDMRDRTAMGIETTDMRGRIETDTGAADMREEIGLMIHAGGTTEETDVMIHAGDDLGDVSMFPSMKENVEARRVKRSKGKEPVRSQSIKITFEGDMATTPIRVAATKSAGGSISKKTDTDYVMAEKDGGQRIDGEEVIFSPRKWGVKKFLMKSSLDEIDTVEPLRRALRQPMQCSILEYLAASKPARDELQMITRKTRVPLSEEAQGAPKAEASTVAVTGVPARADRMATVLLDGMEGVPPNKFYILGSGAVETIINDGAVLDAVIDNGSEAVIIDEDLAVQVGLDLDKSYLFEIRTADGRKQQITWVCHKATIEVQGVRVTLPVFAVKNCSSDLLLGRTWLSHVHAVTIE
ncbi:hypothetical protein CBR_g50305 [Chara braunii]|uniref:Uncharacterized protein n=1 Tax=Chara braunii TaxID=69332 RepID=A0A388K5P3_CHABU|nr:hypothetical protein CBR_g50305 [Chara braunii]|eukprot:GBG65263.1 hypothetical protein CBR_g50305 [Chara braunii]